MEFQIYSVLFFLAGAIIGSFLNVCIVRMPQEKSVVTPRSHCVHCQKPISWYDNIPLISYLLLRGRCRFCRAKISFRYFTVEFITAVVFFSFYRYFGVTPQLFAYLVMASGFIVATFVDFEHRIIPDEISVGGMFIGLGLSGLLLDLHVMAAPELAIGRMVMRAVIGVCLMVDLIDFLIYRRGFDREDLILFGFIFVTLVAEALTAFLSNVLSANSRLIPYVKSLDASLIGLLLGGGVIYAMGILGDLIFRKESMGGGDVKLMAMVGAFLGWKLALLTFFLAPFFGAVYGIIEKIRTKDSAIAYGPFLVLGALISMFWGEPIIQFILSGYGLYPR